MNLVKELTKDIRTSDDAMASQIRRCLSEKGVDPQNAVIADLFPDDFCFEFGIVAFPENRVFQFGYSYPQGAPGDGRFTEWVDLSDKWKSTPYRNEVQAALNCF